VHPDRPRKPDPNDKAFMTGSDETLVLLRELNHRVKNNFQIIASLINLKKRVADASAREEIRFIEEHVTSMAVAYRLVYATGSMAEVAAADLLPEIVASLRVISGLSADQVEMRGPGLTGVIGLDQAIALGLYLAVSLPPYFDHALATRGRIILETHTRDGDHVVSIAGDWDEGIEFDFLRRKLMTAYVRQLSGAVIADGTAGPLALRIPVPPIGR